MNTPTNNLKEDLWFMQIALEEASKAFRVDEVPIGAVLVSASGEILAKAHNLKEKNHNPLGHAELLAILEGTKKLEDWRLLGSTLYVTLEPCIMCMGALWQSRISRLVFGAYDIKGGALSLNYNLHTDSRLNHRFKVSGGLLHTECSKILSDFFRMKRADYSYDNSN